jgi:hypothetical protein
MISLDTCKLVILKLRQTVPSTLVMIWLVPFFWSGLMGRLPINIHPRLSHQYTAAGLFFPKRSEAWSQMLIQVQRKGVVEWKAVNTSELSPMGAFGYRQRLDRILQETNGKSLAEAVRQRLAVWVAERGKLLHPDQGEVMSVRFGAMAWQANTPELAQPAGHWVPDPPANSSTPPFILLSAFSINQGNALPIAKPAHVKPGATKPTLNPIPPVFRRNRPATPTPNSSTPVPSDVTPSPQRKTP